MLRIAITSIFNIMGIIEYLEEDNEMQISIE